MRLLHYTVCVHVGFIWSWNAFIPFSRKVQFGVTVTLKATGYFSFFIWLDTSEHILNFFCFIYICVCVRGCVCVCVCIYIYIYIYMYCIYSRPNQTNETKIFSLSCESCHEQSRLLRTSGKRVDVAHQAGKVTKPSLKSLDSTNPQSDRLCTNGGNSRPQLPSWEVVDQQRSLQSRRCNTFSFSHWLILIFMSSSSAEHWAGVHDRVTRRKTRFSKKKIASCGRVRGRLEKGLMDGWNQNRTCWFKWEAIMFREKNLRIFSHLWDVVVLVSRLGPVFLFLAQDSMPSLMEQWILSYTSKV